MKIKFDWDRGRRKGIVSGDIFEEIRAHFSVKNEAAKFARFRGRFIPPRNYVITPAGRFDPGLTMEIVKFVEDNYNIKIETTFTDDFAKNVFSPYHNGNDITVPELNLPLRDYQKEIVLKCISTGRGVVILATAGGKTLTIATLLEYVYQKDKDFKCALIVPDRGLVEQTYSDFTEYGTSFKTSKWTGDDELDLSANVIVCNLGILQSNKSDTSWLSAVDMCVVDEVHKLRKGNKVNKLFKELRTCNIFGLTGTMPEETIDQWNIIGKIGPVLYEKGSYELRNNDYIADVKAQILRLEYAAEPKYPATLKTPAERYRVELDFIIHNDFRNKVLSSLCKKFDKNALLLVDYIEHGTLLHQQISARCPDKKVYFIRGDVAVEDRERVRSIMEMEDNVIVVAISKVFSTGINIKNLHYIIFGSGGKAKIKTIQSIGRGLRLHKNKTELIIFDIGDDLYYGRQHLAGRIAHYEQENIKYGAQTIKEKNS